MVREAMQSGQGDALCIDRVQLLEESTSELLSCLGEILEIGRAHV